MLFNSITIRGKSVKNRIVMPAMVPHGKGDFTNNVTDKSIAHYKARSENEVGLIITEALAVSCDSKVSDSQIGIWNDSFIPSLKKLTDECRKNGTVIIAQLHHAGFKTTDSDKKSPSPFDYTLPDGTGINGRELTSNEIHQIVNDFKDAAVRAEKAGFDGVELQFAHGYMVSQFLSSAINIRTDKYKDPLAFPLEILCAVRKNVSFIVGIRCAYGEPDIANGIRIAREYEKAGADFLNVSAGFNSDRSFSLPLAFPFSHITFGAKAIKEAVSIPVFAVGGIKTYNDCEYLLNGNFCDMVCIGKALLCDSQWAVKIRNGIAPKSCFGCKSCGWFSSSGICPSNKEKL